jgi:hypothetical protein
LVKAGTGYTAQPLHNDINPILKANSGRHGDPLIRETILSVMLHIKNLMSNFQLDDRSLTERGQFTDKMLHSHRSIVSNKTINDRREVPLPIEGSFLGF